MSSPSEPGQQEDETFQEPLDPPEEPTLKDVLKIVKEIDKRLESLEGEISGIQNTVTEVNDARKSAEGKLKKFASFSLDYLGGMVTVNAIMLAKNAEFPVTFFSISLYMVVFVFMVTHVVLQRNSGRA